MWSAKRPDVGAILNSPPESHLLSDAAFWPHFRQATAGPGLVIASDLIPPSTKPEGTRYGEAPSGSGG